MLFEYQSFSDGNAFSGSFHTSVLSRREFSSSTVAEVEVPSSGVGRNPMLARKC